MMTLTALAAALCMGTVQGPAHDYEKVLVLREVRVAGFSDSQIAILGQAASHVDLADADYDAQVETARKDEQALQGVLASLVAGEPLTADEKAAVEAAARARASAVDRWNQRVEAAVTRVLATFTEEQRYVLGVPADVRKNVADALNRVRAASNAEWEGVARSLVSRLTRAQTNALRSANRGGSDRSQRQDRSARSSEYRAMQEEIQRQGRAYLDRVRSGNAAAARGFQQQLASSYMRDGDVERNLRELVRRIITADGAAEALAEARGGA